MHASAVSDLFLVGACSVFHTSDLGLMACLLLLAILSGASMLQGHKGYIHTALLSLLQMSFICFMIVLFARVGCSGNDMHCICRSGLLHHSCIVDDNLNAPGSTFNAQK